MSVATFATLNSSLKRFSVAIPARKNYPGISVFYIRNSAKTMLLHKNQRVLGQHQAGSSCIILGILQKANVASSIKGPTCDSRGCRLGTHTED